MNFSSRSYSYGGLLRLGEHHISTTTLIKSFSGLANDLKLSKFWLKYIDRIKVVKIETLFKAPDTALYSSTDASSDGGGFTCGRDWAAFPFNEERLKWHINQKELYVIIVMINSLRKKLKRKIGGIY